MSSSLASFEKIFSFSMVQGRLTKFSKKFRYFDFDYQQKNKFSNNNKKDKDYNFNSYYPDEVGMKNKNNFTKKPVFYQNFYNFYKQYFLFRYAKLSEFDEISLDVKSLDCLVGFEARFRRWNL